MAGTMKSANPKATITEKSKGKQGGTNGVAKVQTGIKAKSSGKVNTPPKGAVPAAKYGKAVMKMGGMKSKKSC
jgi:hypothetical protein